MIEPILFVSADLPWPPDGGGRIATLRVLEAMAKDRSVDLVALSDSPDVDLSRLGSICRRVVVISHPFTFGRHPVRQLTLAAVSAVSGTPYRVAKFRSRRLSTTLSELKRETSYGLVHHDQFGVAEYHDPSLPSTLTTQNIESELFRLGATQAGSPIERAWAGVEARRLRKAEPKLCAAFDHVFTLSHTDSALLADLGVARSSVLPIPAGAPDEAPQPAIPGPTLLTMGSMSWFGVEDGLLWFYREVWPRIVARCPAVTWTIAGPYASRAIQRLGDDPAITVTGYVDDIDSVIAGSRVAVIPLHIAGGVRIKLLELMARGRPSVATSIGAQGLAFADGEGCFRRDDPEGFANATVDLLRDDALWRRTGRTGWAYVKAHHSPDAMTDAVNAGIEQALRRHRDRHGDKSSARL